jgi:hypothetical protein
MSTDGALSYEAFPSVFTATPQFNRETYVESLTKFALEESDYRAVTFEINAENWFGRFSEPATFGVSQDNSVLGVRQNRITNELLLIKEYEEDSNCVTEAFGMKEGIDCVFYAEIEEEMATLTTYEGYTHEGYDDFA